MKQALRITAAALFVAGLVCIGVFFFKGAGAGKLTWDPAIVRKSLMTFAYKVYANPAVLNGRFFLSKIVFHNTGTGPVYDLSISYQIPGYVQWTTPETHREIPPGQSIVQLYYPQLPSDVTKLTSETPTTLETKIRWSDKPGETKEEILRSPVVLRGVNQIEYTDLPANELLTWYDEVATTPFAAAMVTPDDPVVKEFAAEITKRMGGTTAGQKGGEPGRKELMRLMEATYNYMCEIGMRYVGDEGVPATIGDVRTTIQKVRLPRDVITTNQGLCIELALLWASVMEHLGCPSTLVFPPGHCFTAVSAGPQRDVVIPIECTAISPQPGGMARPFDQAQQRGDEEFQEGGPKILVDVREYQTEGFRPPELPPPNIAEIKNILAERTKQTATAHAQTAGPGAAPAAAPRQQQVRQGYFRWVGANNMASIDVPESWTRTEASRVPGLVFVAHDKQTSMDVDVFYFPNLSKADEAMGMVQRGVAQYAGGTVKINNQQQKGKLTVYTGTTLNQKAPTYQWYGLFGPAQRGVVGFLIGAAEQYFERDQPIIRDIASSARIAAGEQAQP